MVSTNSKEPRRGLVWGVGTNNATYPVKPKINGKQYCCPIYQAWSSMLNRCYSKARQDRNPTYTGCTVADEWLMFMTFWDWMTKQDWENKHLDKDLLIAGNKVYSPETCIFVSARVNSLMNDNRNARGDLPIGVCLHHGRYIAQCSSRPEGRYIGSFDTPELAHAAWRTEKKRVITIVADEQADHMVKQALLNVVANFGQFF